MQQIKANKTQLSRFVKWSRHAAAPRKAAVIAEIIQYVNFGADFTLRHDCGTRSSYTLTIRNGVAVLTNNLTNESVEVLPTQPRAAR